jgi:hypothetical protein
VTTRVAIVLAVAIVAPRISVAQGSARRPAIAPNCDPVRDTAQFARPRANQTQLFATADGRRFVAGRLDTTDLVRIVGRGRDTAFVQAPIADYQLSFPLSLRHLCAVPSPVLTDSLYPLPGRQIDQRVIDQMALLEIGAEQLAQSVASDTRSADRAGNRRGVAFLAVKWYEQRGRPMPNATGWYDHVNVHYFAFEELLVEPRDLGVGASMELRQGHDPDTRRLLKLLDPGNVGFPFAVYGGSNSVNRTVFAIVPGQGGVWLAYSCANGRPRVSARSQLNFQGVRPALDDAAMAICNAKGRGSVLLRPN